MFLHFHVVAFVRSFLSISDMAVLCVEFLVVWTRTNPVPRNTIEQDQNIKILAVSKNFEGGRFVVVAPLSDPAISSRFFFS